eukprot:173895-Chlamydomonas_euryale.AAC.1
MKRLFFSSAIRPASDDQPARPAPPPRSVASSAELPASSAMPSPFAAGGRADAILAAAAAVPDAHTGVTADTAADAAGADATAAAGGSDPPAAATADSGGSTAAAAAAAASACALRASR